MSAEEQKKREENPRTVRMLLSQKSEVESQRTRVQLRLNR